MGIARRALSAALALGALVSAGSFLAACEGEVRTLPRPPRVRRDGGAAGEAVGDGGTHAAAPLDLRDLDFVESARTRDPFRNFASEGRPTGPVIVPAQHTIVLRDHAIDELRVVAVVISADDRYALIIDPTGNGTIVRPGHYVGRPETIQSTVEGAVPHEVPWRVARIIATRVRRENNNLVEIPGEVTFEREDPLNPGSRVERTITLIAGEGGGRGAAGGTTTTTTTSSTPAPLPGLPPGFSLPSPGAASSPRSGGAAPGTTVTQSYTTITPPAPAPAPAPTTFVIQTGPQGQTTVTPGGSASSPAPAAPRSPYAPPGGGIEPPPVQVTNGPTSPSPPLPTSGLPR